MDSWYATAKELEARGESYVLATVIRAVAPTSGKPGDKAVVTEEGVVHGWIGGSCAEPTIKKEAKAALADGACRVVNITPEPNVANDREGLVVVPMTCYSGGELEIYLEPHRAKRELVVFGNSPVAQALVEFGIAVGYKVSVVDTTERPPLEGATVITALDQVELLRPEEAAIVVATHGVFDEDAIASAVELSHPATSAWSPAQDGFLPSEPPCSAEASRQKPGRALTAPQASTSAPPPLKKSPSASSPPSPPTENQSASRPNAPPKPRKEQAAKPVIEEAIGAEAKGHCCHD